MLVNGLRSEDEVMTNGHLFRNSRNRRTADVMIKATTRYVNGIRVISEMSNAIETRAVEITKE
jgi:hypothetical protein